MLLIQIRVGTNKQHPLISNLHIRISVEAVVLLLDLQLLSWIMAVPIIIVTVVVLVMMTILVVIMHMELVT